MATIHPSSLRPPLQLSGRHMASVTLDDGRSTIHIQPLRRDDENRVVWRYIIDANDHVLDDTADLRTGVGDPVNHRSAMVTLLGFLGAAAEAYRHTMTGHDIDLFPPDVAEWAYQHDDELAALALDLDQPGTGYVAQAERDAVWWDIWSQTNCADCAKAATTNDPWGPDHCWATHRPHQPDDRRRFTPARQDQGFRNQAHLDAFYAYYDHSKTCTDCGPGPAVPLDDGLQPTRIDCPTGRDLYTRSLAHNSTPNNP